MTTANAPSLELRTVPTQQRSKQTFEHILTTTGELLEEVGFETFNTNLLAKRSNLTVRAIYRYFPNKFSLVLELAKRMELGWREAIELTTAAQRDSVWPDSWPKYLDAYISTVHSTPGGVAVLRAMKSHPELRAVDDEMTTLYITDVAKALLENSGLLSRKKANEIATILLSTTVAVIDASLDVSPSTAKSQLDMLKLMHRALLTA